MANVKPYAQWVLKWEGGYVNDPKDAGGETNKGITLATWKSCGHDISEKLKNVVYKGKCYNLVTKSLYEMTEEQFEKILKEKYWDRWQADEIKSQSVAEMLVQWTWGSGSVGIKRPQRMLELKDDGIVGNITLNAVNAQNPREFWERLKEARKDYFNEIVANRPSNQKFLQGWLNRLNSMQFTT